MGSLASIASRHGLLPAKEGAPSTPERLKLGNQSFVISDRRGMTYEPNADDEDAVLASIREARKKAPLVVFSIHAHETASADWDDPDPATFLRPLFHKAIDAGAGAIVRHGPHVLNGIEIYRGKPIFYSMGSLFFDFGGARSYTIPGTNTRIDFPDTWFETAVATTEYRGEQVSEIRIYPMLIEVSTKPTCGVPNLARGADAQRILERLRRDSRQFGTEISIVNDVGIIRGPGAAKTKRP
jgi:poly-gamma-glutamate synthesis protein (capsule biosynthesis protein)